MILHLNLIYTSKAAFKEKRR